MELGRITRAEIIEQAKESYSPEFADRVYGLQMFLSGFYDSKAKDFDSAARSYSRGLTGTSWWNEYAECDLRPLTRGVHDHALISTRVMVQSIVYSEPEYYITIADPLVRAYNEEWLKARWKLGRWPATFLDMGMTGYEPAGVAFCEVGLTRAGDKNYVDIRAINPLDCIYDNVNKNPAHWEWFLIRHRFSKRSFLKDYAPVLGLERCVEIWESYSRIRGSASFGPHSGTSSPNVIYTFSYWHEEEHCVLLGSMESGVMLVWDENEGDGGGYVESVDGRAGMNPFGIIPVSVWWDNYSPASQRPIGKAEGTYRIVAQANLIEERITQLIDNTVPITAISTYHVQDKNLIEHLRAGKGINEWGKPILTFTPDISKAIMRTPQADVSPSIFAYQQRMDALISGATGVEDAARGQGLARDAERVTAFELSRQAELQGTQARHMRHQFAAFLSDLCTKARYIGSQFDTLGDTVYADGIEFDGEIYPSSIMLGEPANVMVTEDALMTSGKQGAMRKAMERFTQITMPFISMMDPQSGMPVVNASKAYLRLAKAMGEIEPEKIMNVPAGSGTPQSGMPMAQTPGGLPPEAQSTMNEVAGTMEGANSVE